jgi:glycosyltransferase involved in cell wall biosynthesis
MTGEPSLRFAMVTTFYPPYHFGGDAMYIYRLSHALAARGHSVDVLHDVDAYRLARSQPPAQSFEGHPRVRVFPMKSAAGFLSPLATQQTGYPLFKPLVRGRLTSGDYDVIHYHNMSLIGSAALGYGEAVKLYTTHEHWLICPMHVLWKFDREPCDTPSCLACCLRGGRPPQLWRYTGRLERDLQHVDRILSPSRFTRARHERAGIERPISVLPYFVPAPPPGAESSPHPRPYFLFVGRLVALKGVDALINAFRGYADADLLIAGEGEERQRLEALAADVPNIVFLGACDQRGLATLYRHAEALVMPSTGFEVFGIVLLEAFAHHTPVIVRDLGGMPEAVEDSGGGFTFRTDAELIAAMHALQSSPALRRQMGAKGHAAWIRQWSEAPHVDAYLSLVDDERHRRPPPGGAGKAPA